MKLKEDICIMENVPTPDFWYKVVWLFPKELRSEKIFQDNLQHTLNDLKEIIKLSDTVNINKKILEQLKFDSQKEKQKKVVEKYEIKLEAAFANMNECISPYYWQIVTDVNSYFYDMLIEADYLLMLHQ